MRLSVMRMRVHRSTDRDGGGGGVMAENEIGDDGAVAMGEAIRDGCMELEELWMQSASLAECVWGGGDVTACMYGVVICSDIYIHIHVCICTRVYIYIHVYQEGKLKLNRRLVGGVRCSLRNSW